MINTFKVTGEWKKGLRVDTQVRNFALSFDEPPSLGGEDSACNPVEGLLASLAGCLGIVARVVAQEKSLPIEKIQVEIEGDLDPRGFMGQYDQVRPGLLAVRYQIKISGKISDKDLKEFAEEVDKRCPVSDTLKNGTKVEGKVTL